jgi:cephalosporin hydroxylase
VSSSVETLVRKLVATEALHLGAKKNVSFGRRYSTDRVAVPDGGTILWVYAENWRDRSPANGNSVKSILDWTVREWLEYHQRNVHQAALTGKAQLQQRWLGRPIWKNPMDCWVYQEILYDTQPELVIELGIAHGGNLLFMADIFRCMNRGRTQIVGIDMDISRARDLKLPGLHLIEGTCQDESVFERVSDFARGKRTMIIADCDHSRDHVLDELTRYSPLVSVGCYYIVEDGICDVMGWHPLTGQLVNDQPAPGPQAASLEFLRNNPQFTDDAEVREKYLITYNFNGFLKRVA